MFPRVEVVHLCRLLPSCYFMFLFQLLSPHVILAYFVLYFPLKILYGKLELSTTIINIIISKPRGPYLPLF